jgi:hypothetical protein
MFIFLPRYLGIRINLSRKFNFEFIYENARFNASHCNQQQFAFLRCLLKAKQCDMEMKFRLEDNLFILLFGF